MNKWNWKLKHSHFSCTPKSKILKVKYLRISLTNIYITCIYITLRKCIKEKLSKWRNIPCSWTGRLSVKISVLPNLIYKFKTILIKISASYFVVLTNRF